MDLNALNDLYRHMEWADALVWQAVLASDDTSKDEKLREYFYHLHLVQRVFLRGWRGEARDTPYPTFADARSLMNWGRSYYGEVCNHVETLTDESVSKPMEHPWTDIVEQELGQKPEPVSLGEMMLQVPLHSLYHRGQINARLRAVGGEPPRVDYIVWLWLGRPAPAWDF